MTIANSQARSMEAFEVGCCVVYYHETNVDCGALMLSGEAGKGIPARVLCDA